MKVTEMRKHLGRPVILEWEDACGTDDWNDEADVADVDTVTIRTLGYLTAVSRKVVKVSRHLSDGDYSGTHAVPAGMVVSVWVLEDGPEISGS